jgi:hypothetical protein
MDGMERSKLIAVVGLGMTFACGMLRAAHTPRTVQMPTLLVQEKRQSKTDLEVSGLPSRNGNPTRGFIRYEDLLALPQVSGSMGDDDDLAGLREQTVPVTGVRLSVLMSRLGVPRRKDLVLARCSDGYAGPFPAEYIAAHEPILVLMADGMTLGEWARKTGSDDPGPYMIAYNHFLPSWKVLSYSDRQQLPDQVVELEFRKLKNVLDPITPPVSLYPSGSPERIGFTIAQQNCLRCHSAGPYGGTKGGLSWEAIAKLAKSDGTTFSKFVHDPKSVDPKSQMPGNPGYDAETLQAIAAYFKSQAKN